MLAMKNLQKTLQPITFILAWTLLWVVVIGVATAFLYFVSIEGLNLTTLTKIMGVAFKVLPGSLFGSLISYVFMHHWFPHFKSKRILMALLWGIFWGLYGTVLMFSQPSPPGNPPAISFIGSVAGVILVLVLVPLIIGIAHLASFAPILRSKN
jgi:ABC-type enterobactin transport system permease subunit